MTQAPRLVLLRHGQSEWNAAGVFTGWENASLTAAGEEEATRAGLLMAAHGLLPAFVHTSLQHRTIRTAELTLTTADRDWIPVRRCWRLNGRHYGALQGRRKDQVRREYGDHQFTAWRRSYDATPPRLDTVAAARQRSDPRYAMLPPDMQPRAESLRDVSARLLPYFYDAIVPDLLAGGCVLVVSHGNTLRALVKYLESIPDEQIAGLDIPTGRPLVYELGPDLRPDELGGSTSTRTRRGTRSRRSGTWTRPRPEGGTHDQDSAHRRRSGRLRVVPDQDRRGDSSRPRAAARAAASGVQAGSDRMVMRSIPA